MFCPCQKGQKKAAKQALAANSQWTQTARNKSGNSPNRKLNWLKLLRRVQHAMNSVLSAGNVAQIKRKMQSLARALRSVTLFQELDRILGHANNAAGACSVVGLGNKDSA